MEKILNIINEILSDKEKNPLENLTLDLSLRNDIGFDSLDLAKLTVLIEDEFEVDIFENGIVDRISEIVNLIDTREIKAG